MASELRKVDSSWTYTFKHPQHFLLLDLSGSGCDVECEAGMPFLSSSPVALSVVLTPCIEDVTFSTELSRIKFPQVFRSISGVKLWRRVSQPSDYRRDSPGGGRGWREGHQAGTWWGQGQRPQAADVDQRLWLAQARHCCKQLPLWGRD